MTDRADPIPPQSPVASPVKAVLFVSHQLHLGGVATHMNALGRGLIERGVRVGVVAREMNDGQQFGRAYFEAAGITPVQCDFPAYGLAPSNVRKAVLALRGLRRIADDFDADVLHVHAPTLCLSARFSGRPYVTTFHMAVTGRNKTRLARLANRVSPTAFGQAAIAISDELERNLVHDLRIPSDRVRRVRLTVDDTLFSPATSAQKSAARVAYGVGPDDLVVCMVASLEDRKNHTLLLDAVLHLGPERSRVKVLLAGSGWGDMAERLEAGILDRNVGDVVRYLGQQPALRVYHASDVFVLPSLHEGFPLTTIEAMFCGLVPIRTPSEGATEQIDDERTGFIVPFGRPEVLAERIGRLAHDEALRNRLSGAARADAVDRFRRDRMVEATLGIYESAVGR